MCACTLSERAQGSDWVLGVGGGRRGAEELGEERRQGRAWCDEQEAGILPRNRENQTRLESGGSAFQKDSPCSHRKSWQ